MVLVVVPRQCMAQTAGDFPTVTIRSSVHLVEVDVIATDRHGNPVPGLEAKDFTLLDDGKPQKISRLSVQASGSLATEKLTHEPPDRFTPVFSSNTHPENLVPTVILFDALNTAQEDQASMRKGLVQSLNHFREGTPVALLILGDDLTVVSDFTTSTIPLAAAMTGSGPRAEGFGPAFTVRATGNPIIDGALKKVANSVFRAEDHERQVRTLAALNVICKQLSQIRGRKSLLWVTGGLSTQGESAVQDVIDELNDANVAVYTIDARGVLLDPGISAENDSKDLTTPMQEERAEARGDILFTVAAATGGIAYHNTNRLDGAFAQAMNDRSLVYSLEYYPQHGRWQGKLHKLEVRTSHPGVHLRYRASYRATLPAQPNAQEQQQMLAQIESAPLEYSGIHFSVELKPGNLADPQFVVHVPGEEIQWAQEEAKMSGTIHIWFVQRRASGEDIVTSHANSPMSLDLDAYHAALSHGITLASNVTLQHGVAKVRVLLRDENSGKIGSVDVPVAPNLATQAAH